MRVDSADVAVCIRQMEHRDALDRARSSNARLSAALALVCIGHVVRTPAVRDWLAWAAFEALDWAVFTTVGNVVAVLAASAVVGIAWAGRNRRRRCLP